MQDSITPSCCFCCCYPYVSTTYVFCLSFCDVRVVWQGRTSTGRRILKKFRLLSPLVSFPTISLSLSSIRQTFSALLPLTQEGVSHTRTRRPLNLLSDSSVPLCQGPKKERKIYVRGQKKEQRIYVPVLCLAALSSDSIARH